MIKTAALLVAAALLSFTPPSGRPPIGPLERYEPRIHDLGFDVVLSTIYDIQPTFTPNSRTFNLKDAPIVMPVIFQSAYSEVSRDSMKAEMWYDGKQVADLSSRQRIDDVPGLFNSHQAVMVVDEFKGITLRWKLEYRTQVFSSRINDAGAAKLTWPREWPDEVKDGLKPQPFIDSDNPIFAKAVETVTQGKLRSVPPYYAAKELVRYCLLNFQVNGSANVRGLNGVLRGMELTGASKAAAAGTGNPHDLVCVCVATLRAAGIPARPVIGVEEDVRGLNKFVSWVEFYLHGAGWIPFDPDIMRGKGVRQLKVQDAWPAFGTMDDLNRRIPLAFSFIPPSTQAPGYVGIWGWDPRPGGDPGAQPSIMLSTVSRGRGTEDPR